MVKRPLLAKLVACDASRVMRCGVLKLWGCELPLWLALCENFALESLLKGTGGLGAGVVDVSAESNC